VARPLPILPRPLWTSFPLSPTPLPAMAASPSRPTIDVNDLTFRFPDYSIGLANVQLSLPAGSRTLLIGANGAGKTTLLRLLSGKRLAPSGSVKVATLD